ncbi:unnamed protein product [Effrenium voratum]|uniref:Uncharacterized protein n=1 Tax=Effrenium voratum TaxID=2562239 RepID=A0AA36JNK9_9DINO|nr:unnamed protein product [Effrenium voratum]CAJ1408881.1 unnamed protein product [Effrenium voratum]
MSYSTMDKFGDMKHIYAPPRSDAFVRGIWWPDYGPMTVEFSNQAKMHPTNTIFENQIAKPVKAKRDLMARPMGRPEPPMPQFRRQPPTEALWSSTIIQPYKSGGRMPEIFEGAWHRKAHQSHTAHEEAVAETLTRRTLKQQELSMSLSPKRSLSCSLSPCSLPKSPSWVAASSRPLDAAGLNGNARGRVYKDGASELGLDPECAAARTLEKSRSFTMG